MSREARHASFVSAPSMTAYPVDLIESINRTLFPKLNAVDISSPIVFNSLPHFNSRLSGPLIDKGLLPLNFLQGIKRDRERLRLPDDAVIFVASRQIVILSGGTSCLSLLPFSHERVMIPLSGCVPYDPAAPR